MERPLIFQMDGSEDFTEYLFGVLSLISHNTTHVRQLPLWFTSKALCHSPFILAVRWARKTNCAPNHRAACA